MTGGAQAAADEARKGRPKPERPLSDVVVSLPDFMATEFPPREWIIEDWIPEQGSAMLYAHRGTGKSWMAMSAGLAVARGEKFALWGTKPGRVIYVQAEMPQVEDQKRIKLLLGDIPAPENFTYLSYQKMRDLQMPPLKLDLPGSTAAIHRILQEARDAGNPYTLIIFDSYSSLTSVGFDPNSAADVRPVGQFLTDLKLDGTSPLLLHHTTKGRTEQRGSSLLEDQLDTSILLYREPTNKNRDAEFKVLFPKTRDRGPEYRDPILTLCMQADGRLDWTRKREAKDEHVNVILRAVDNGEAKLAVDLEAILDKPTATISRWVRTLKNQKLLKNQKALALTDKGRGRLPTDEERAFADADCPF